MISDFDSHSIVKGVPDVVQILSEVVSLYTHMPITQITREYTYNGEFVLYYKHYKFSVSEIYSALSGHIIIVLRVESCAYLSKCKRIEFVKNVDSFKSVFDKLSEQLEFIFSGS